MLADVDSMSGNGPPYVARLVIDPKWSDFRRKRR